MKTLKKNLCLALAFGISFNGLALSVHADDNEPEQNLCIEDITINTSNTSYGKQVETITYTVSNVSDYENLTPDDFQIHNGMTDALEALFEEIDGTGKEDIQVNEVSFTDTEIILSVDPVLIEASSIAVSLDDFEVVCTDDTLSFTYADITNIVCPEVDVFTDGVSEVGEATVPYKLYSPENTDGPLPIVIYNHGGGAASVDILLTNDSFATSWVLPEAQKEFPCYVLAPYRESSPKGDDLNAAIKAIIDSLVAEGKVDSNRIYMAGESAGSIYTVTFANAYPGYLAGISLMNGGPMVEDIIDLETIDTLELDAPWDNDHLKTLAESGTSVLFVQGIGDILSTPDRFAAIYTKLQNYGMVSDENLKWISYTAEEYNALLTGTTEVPNYDPNLGTATDPITGKTTFCNGNFHNTSRVAGADPAVRAWTKAQTLGTKITVNTKNTSYGKEAHSITLSVSDSSAYQDLTAADFQIHNGLVDAMVFTKEDIELENVEINNNQITLTVHPFLIEASSVDVDFCDFYVDCTNDDLDFSYQNINQVICPDVDQFTYGAVSYGDTSLPYMLYSPEAQDEPLPLVIWHHGGGCTGLYGVLTDDDFTTSWATSEAQSKFPCYVLAPYRMGLTNQDEVFNALKLLIDGLVDDGKVDPTRIIMTGGSMGSLDTMSFVEDNQGYLAGIILMNGGPFGDTVDINDIENVHFTDQWSDENLKALAESDTRVMFIQGIGDYASAPDKFAAIYTKLQNYGMTSDEDLVWISYSDDEYNALLTGDTQVIDDLDMGVNTDPITEKTSFMHWAFHNTPRVASGDQNVHNWVAENWG